MRRGAALLVVLVALTTLTVVAVSARQIAANALARSANRQFLVRAQFQAEGCAAALLAAVDERLEAASTTDRQDALWATLADSMPVQTPAGTMRTCRETILPVGTRVDINSADTLALHSALLDMAGPAADQLYDLLMDWRDPDRDVRPLGRERPAYRALSIWGPTDERFTSIDQLLSIPEFTPFAPVLDAYLGTDDAPLWTAGASAVLSARTLALHAPERLPSAWEMIITMPAPASSLCAALHLRVVRLGDRVHVARRVFGATESTAIAAHEACQP